MVKQVLKYQTETLLYIVRNKQPEEMSVYIAEAAKFWSQALQAHKENQIDSLLHDVKMRIEKLQTDTDE